MRRVDLDFNTESEISSYALNNITPFSMRFVDHPAAEGKIASLFFIAQTQEQETFTIYTSYYIENEMEYELAKNYPFYVENNFPTFRICADIINNSYPLFISDFEFTYNKEEEIDKFSFLAKRVSLDGELETVKFLITSDIFASIKYVDNYIFDGDYTGYELSIASITGRRKEDPSEVVIVDKIDRIIAIAKVSKDMSTCAIEFLAKSGDNTYNLLCTFNFSQNFNRKKFKGMTIKKINDKFLKESDQYLQLFIEYARFTNIDKEYLVIKAKNKDYIDKLFLLDSTIRMELESMIVEY